MLRSLSAPATSWSSALIAALIGFGGTVALIVQAVQTMGGSAAQTTSAVTALCLGIAVAGAALSFAYRMPIVLAWSTPGAALIGASTLEVGWPITIGAFIAAAAMMAVLGLVPALGRLAARIPPAVASAMLAGVLLPFCLALFRTFQADAALAAVLLMVFIVARQRLPLYAMLLVLAAAVALVFLRDDVSAMPPSPLFGTLVPTTPEFSSRAIVSLAIPLFLVTLVSQNLPGLVVLRSAGYEPSPQPLLFVTGLNRCCWRRSARMASISLRSPPRSAPARRRIRTSGSAGSSAFSMLASTSCWRCSRRRSSRCSWQCRRRRSPRSPGSHCSLR